MWLRLKENNRVKKMFSVIVMMGHRSVLEAKQVLFILKCNTIFFWLLSFVHVFFIWQTLNLTLAVIILHFKHYCHQAVEVEKQHQSLSVDQPASPQTTLVSQLADVMLHRLLLSSVAPRAACLVSGESLCPLTLIYVTHASCSRFWMCHYIVGHEKFTH